VYDFDHVINLQRKHFFHLRLYGEKILERGSGRSSTRCFHNRLTLVKESINTANASLMKIMF